MEEKFWKQKWEEGKINFHQGSVNESLLHFFPKLRTPTDRRVLVPLCGKSKDLLWLQEQGLQVLGIKFNEKAVTDFYEENAGLMKDNLEVRVADFFKLAEDDSFDLIFDRAALVALPLEMRNTYAEVVTRSCKLGGRILLISIEYDQATRSGPPFSVDEREIRRLYEQRFEIKLLDKDVYSLLKVC